MVGLGDLWDQTVQNVKYVGSGQMTDDMSKELRKAAETVNDMVGGPGGSNQNQSNSGSGVVKVSPAMSIMSIKPKDGWNIWAPQRTSPIHEIQTLVALAHSDAYPTWILKGSGPLSEDTLTDLREYLRGAIWNDDPVCHLFHDNANWNFDRKQGYVVSYGADYLGVTQTYNMFKGTLGLMNSWAGQEARDAFIKAGMPSLTQRTHEGDMQFLHCMAQEKGETVLQTVAKVMRWCEVMYNIAIGKLDESRQLAAISLPWFSQFTTPSGTDTVRTLFAGSTPSYSNINVSKRALGSIFHVIQDSYAAGHCSRNPPFQGPIEQCHTFTGQDHEKHSDLDHSSKKIEDISLGDLDSFNGWQGVRPGIDACIKLANFWGQKKPFKDGVEAFLRYEVFAVAPTAKGADSSI